ncbi:MAG: hypothetical protein A2722_00930 [Candidatus Doudnabacteria bacterium RIFCSPHIGHO2_01_FULL_50_11]|uniref:Uncharacterized protein n=1 Tax=Candidatus Doudnabacteria bacterium RIFCSPHIGHO2_01_FULL_50_11 TaxID=1817828 RepID=A0A1F5PFJ0_9BACT|nr:MAG: hypothetical protein A2722_00930 [Candidatus Doudnabacteria bacterium RIFCSPHIGHO2_01_FULL_50_11]HLC44716.1 hypothetical protein [Patescibacteria group bacterium]
MEEERSEDFGFAPEPLPENLPDMQVALFLAMHIDNPCGVEVSPGQRENIRQFYLREAAAMLDKFTNPSARAMLESKIEEYKDKK